MIDFPKQKYEIIYADPPWPSGTTCLAKSSFIPVPGEISNVHYFSMTMAELCALPVKDITAQNCLLFMWTRSPSLPKAIHLGEAWGFKYVTVAFVWDKQLPVVGNYTMSQVELCLLFKHGRIPQPRGPFNVRQFLSERKRQHSRKPDTIRDRIEIMFPQSTKIELFARQHILGWDVWGDEV